MDAVEKPADREPRAKLAVFAGALAALGASSCCILPLLLFSLGASGAWIGTLSSLEPYRPVFIGAAVGCLGWGHWLVYLRRDHCKGGACVRPVRKYPLQAGLWAASLLVVLSAFWNLIGPAVAPILLGL